MASCNYSGGKCKGGTEAKAFLRHDERDMRLQDNHTNEHIDKNKTSQNTSVYGLTYKEMCEKYDNRIDELDRTTNRNKRKDRVTMQSIEIPVPADLPRDRYAKYFQNVTKLLCDQYGEENLIDGMVHYDEEHEYMDPDTKQMTMSRVHGHYNFVSEHEGQLNGKWFSSKANMVQLNNSIEKMCQEEFGVRFMDGSKKKGNKSVEQLKNESSQAYKDKMDELEEQMIHNAEELARDKAELELEYRERNEDLEAERLDLMLDRKSFDATVNAEVQRRERIRTSAQAVSDAVQPARPNRRLPELGF